MKFIKYLAFTFVAALALAGCKEDDFSLAAAEDNMQVYFSNLNPSEWYVDDSQSSVAIEVCRVKADEPYTVGILSSDKSKIFNIPQFVSFAEGVSKAQLLITFDRTDLMDDTQYEIALMINDAENTTIYGESQLNFTIEPWPWIEFEENGSIGKYRDDYLPGIYNVSAGIEVDRKMYRHKSRKDYFMVEDMLGWDLLEAAFSAFGMNKDAMQQAGIDYTKTNVTFRINDDNTVTLPLQPIGMSIVEGGEDLGKFMIAGHVDLPGIYREGVITFPKDGMFFLNEEQTIAGQTNSSGLMRFILPGYEATDYSLSVSYDGLLVDKDNKSAAYFTMNYGADVSGIDYFFAEGDVEYNPLDALMKIAAGEDENVLKVDPFKKGAGSVSIEAELPVGVYTLVAVPRNKAGELLISDYVTSQFYFQGIDVSAAPDCTLSAEYLSPSQMAPYIDPSYEAFTFEQYSEFYKDLNCLAYKISAPEDIKTLSVFYCETADLKYHLASGFESMDEMLAALSTDITSWAVPMIRERGYAWDTAFDLDPGVAHTFIMTATNVYGKRAVVQMDNIMTPAAPVYEGGVVTGEYVISEDYPLPDGTVYPQVSSFRVSATEEEGIYNVTDLFHFDAVPMFRAMYDAEKSTLTLDGTINNTEYRHDVNVFNSLIGELISGGVVYEYLYWSFTDPNSGAQQTAKDPMVFSVDPETKKINALKTYVDMIVVLDEPVDYYASFTPDAEVVHLSDYVAPSPEPSPAAMSVGAPMSGRKVASTASASAAPARMNPLKRVAPEGLRIVAAKSSVCEPLTKELKFKAQGSVPTHALMK